MDSAILYLECQKGGYHFGEALNVVCLEPGCISNTLCCSACVEEYHKKHQVKPLKLVVNEAKAHSQSVKPLTIDVEGIIKLVDGSRKAASTTIYNFRNKVLGSINYVYKLVNNYYDTMEKQIILKSAKPGDDTQKLFYEVRKAETQGSQLEIVQKIISLIPKRNYSSEYLQESDIIYSLNNQNNEVTSLLTKMVEEINLKIYAHIQGISKGVTNFDIWSRSKFKFSTKTKHAEVNVISYTIVKSTGSSAYKFAVMEPDIYRNRGIKKMAFKVKYASMNWLAVGMCHKNVVQSKGYSFTFNVLGHGGYMISSNGGSWSDTKPDVNNSVKSFKFAKNDIILMEANFLTSKLKFRKKGTNESYELDFQTKNDDPLCPCVLFYYTNDEVEYLRDFNEWPV